MGEVKKKKGTITEKRAKRPKEELHQLTDGTAFVIHLRYSLNPRLISNCSSFLSEIFFSFSFERKKRKDFVYFYYFFFICCCCCKKKKSGFVLEARSFDFVWLFYTQLAGAGRRSTACRLVICFFFRFFRARGGRRA